MISLCCVGWHAEGDREATTAINGSVSQVLLILPGHADLRSGCPPTSCGCHHRARRTGGRIERHRYSLATRYRRRGDRRVRWLAPRGRRVRWLAPRGRRVSGRGGGGSDPNYPLYHALPCSMGREILVPRCV